MSVKIKLDGFDEKNIMSELEKDAKRQLSRAGLSRVRVKISKLRGEAVINLDADTDDELARAAKILGIKP